MQQWDTNFLRPWFGVILISGLVFGATPGVAQQPYAHSGSGEVLYNSAGECWGAADGAPNWCGNVPDSDGDGVKNDLDRCPDTSVGETVDAEGCPPDTDRDGVADYGDQCPDTPYGVRVDSKGCALDLDGDGVPYYRDRCCQQLPPGFKVDAEGCLVNLRLENVHFDFDRATLKPGGRQILDSLIGILGERPDVERINVSGHTDSVGSVAYNQGLSERRARSVLRYLQQGGLKQPINAAGYGETRPAVSNMSSAGRAQNRRVEIELKSVPEMRR